MNQKINNKIHNKKTYAIIDENGLIINTYRNKMTAERSIDKLRTYRKEELNIKTIQ